jgi:glycosyltransferase involved in cell wall biosynthesis
MYNALPYLHATLASLGHQTLPAEQFEVIIIDDGSTDGSGAVAEEWAHGRKQTRVIHTPHSGGCAAPRNIGLGLAKGEYVYFFDADDILNPEALARVVGHCKRLGSDVFRLRTAKSERYPTVARFVESSHEDVDPYTTQLLRLLGVVGLVFRTEFLRENGITFPAVDPAEDLPMVTECYLLADRVSALGDYEYAVFTTRDDGQSVTQLRRIPGSVQNVRLHARFPRLVSETARVLINDASPEWMADNVLALTLGRIGRLFAVLLASPDSDVTEAMEAIRRWLPLVLARVPESQLPRFAIPASTHTELRLYLVVAGVLSGATTAELYEVLEWSAETQHRVHVSEAQQLDRAMVAYPWAQLTTPTQSYSVFCGAKRARQFCKSLSAEV